jgi:hypothetical protein
MRVSNGVGLAVILAGVTFLAAGGCGTGTNEGEPIGATDVDGGRGDGTVGFDLDGAQPEAKTLEIDPADSVITVTDLATTQTASLTAKATFADGSKRGVPASWTLDRSDIAGIGAGTGVVTTSNATFGKCNVTAKALGLEAKTTITVKLQARIALGVDPGDQSKLDAATAADPSVTKLAYPYDATVFPKGLLPPEVMWNGGASGDSYLLKLTGNSLDLSIYTKADPPSRFAPTKKVWDALTTTLAGSDANVELRRLTGGTSAYVSARQKWTIANANLRGSIYYWAIDQGQIIKIDLTTGQRGPVFDSGPYNQMQTPAPLNNGNPRTPVWEDNGAGKRCVACHAVSKDGSTLASIFTRESSTGPLGFVSIGNAQVRSIGDYEQNGVFTALTPDGQLGVINTGAKRMNLVDAVSGQAVPSALDSMVDVCDPVFSPDGTKLALATSCDPGFGYPVEFRTSNLSLFDFAQPTRAFTNLRDIVTSTGIGDAIAFPSFSPDSQYVFFQRGSYSRAKYGDNQNGQFLHGVDDLYVVRAQQGATPIELAQANGKGVLPADSLSLNYAPTVNPIAEGGYAWVVFTTPRDYGNRMVSPKGAPPQDATYANHKQLWVTAVDAVIGTADPSHPAFWLPGQDPATANMFGYWALAPCKPTQGDAGPQTCSAGFECCSGFCRDTGSGPVCVDQASGCRQIGEKCTVTADCCNAGPKVSCNAGICQETGVR